MDKQLFAKIGVFALLGLNVGAYYVFWPHQNGGAKSEAKAQPEEKGEVKLMPVKPKELPAKSLDDAVPLSLSTPPKLPEAKSGTEDELVEKLLTRIKEQTRDSEDKPAAPPKLLDMKTIPHLPPPDAGKPGTLPDLDGKALKPENVGVTSPLVPRVPPSPWSIHTEAANGKTLLVDKSQRPKGDPVEFRITCSRYETKADSIQAFGVTFTGAGLKGDCERAIISLDRECVIFEGHVFERIIWEPSATAPASRPAALGAPK